MGELPAGDIPAEAESSEPTPHERVQKLRLGVRIVWWSAVVLTLGFGGAAVWLGLVGRDPFAFFYALLAVCCAMAGYGALLAVRRPSES